MESQEECEKVQRDFIQEVKLLSKSLGEIGIQADEVNNHMEYLDRRFEYVERIMTDLKQKTKASELSAPISIILSGQTTLIKAIEFMQVELTTSIGELWERVRDLGGDSGELTSSAADIYKRVRSLEGEGGRVEALRVRVESLSRRIEALERPEKKFYKLSSAVQAVIDSARGVVHARDYSGTVGDRLQMSITVLSKRLVDLDGTESKKEGGHLGKI